MFKSYLKTSFRFLLKNKTFSFINVVGLAMGTLCCLYILLFISDQYSYDRQHNDVANIYRVDSWLKLTGETHNMATSSPPVGPALKNDFPEILQVVRVAPTSGLGIQKTLLRYKEKSFYETNSVYVDSNFFDLFKYHFVYGNPSGVLDQALSVVLLKPTAEKLFGKVDPVGQTIEIADEYGKNNFLVTGVVDESQGKTHIQANLFVTMRGGVFGNFVLGNQAWAGYNFLYTYIKLRPQARAADLEKKLPSFQLKYGEQQLKSIGMEKKLHLQPVTSIHTTSGYEVELGKSVNPSFLRILLLIAVLVQVIACINFMNLSTARGSQRAKEVGIRKVIGAGKKSLIVQFLGESLLLSVSSVLVAVPLLLLVLPYFNSITGADIRPSFLADYRIWVALISLAILTGLFAGSYPAFYLSAFRITKVLKGHFSSQVSASGLRSVLVVFQFVLSIAFIIGIIVIYSQLNYIKNKDLGFEKDQKIIFSFYTDDAPAKIPSFVNDLRQLSDVKAVSRSNNYLSQNVFNGMGFFLSGGNMATSQNTSFMETDEFFLKANGISLVSGRDFHLHDSSYILINETLARRLRLSPERAPGTKLYSQNSNLQTYTIVGVMKDFNYNALYQNVQPFALMYEQGGTDLSNITVNVRSSDYKRLLGTIETVWRKNFPGLPFEYSFLDIQVQNLYETEITLGRIINSFTIIMILISCLGLFGLTAFNAEQRKKEIGIRKVLGASTLAVTTLLAKYFLKLVIIAIVVAVPIAWWGMDKWLEAFAYKVDLSWWMFASAGLLAIFIAFFTVSFQAIKAAMSNPVDSIRAN